MVHLGLWPFFELARFGCTRLTHVAVNYIRCTENLGLRPAMKAKLSRWVSGVAGDETVSDRA